MAKLEKMLYDDFNRIIGRIEAEILSGSSSASLEDTSDFVDGDARCSVRVFERYSAFGGNRQEEQFPNQRPAMPDNYMLWSILAVVFCCFIPAIVALVFSMRVSSRYYAGDYAGAERSSRMAQIWIIVSIVAGIITNALYLPLMLMTGV